MSALKAWDVLNGNPGQHQDKAEKRDIEAWIGRLREHGYT